MLSIITVTYNNFNELIKTINSIPKSASIESIVINGGQCEETLDYLKSYSGKSISEKDEGIADAFNKAVNLSTGKYIMFLNSGDELIDKSYPEEALKILESSSTYDFVHSNILFVDNQSNQLFMRPQMKNVGRGMPYLHPTMIVRKNLFEKIGLFNKEIRIAMDFDWIVRLEKNASKGFYFGNEAVIRMDGSGKSVVNEYEAIKECYQILKNNKYLTAKNVYGFICRYFLFTARTLIVKTGFKDQLTSLKKIKYSK